MGLLNHIQATVLRRLKDPDDSVVKAALLLLSEHLPQVRIALCWKKRQLEDE